MEAKFSGLLDEKTGTARSPQLRVQETDESDYLLTLQFNSMMFRTGLAIIEKKMTREKKLALYTSNSHKGQLEMVALNFQVQVRQL